MYQTRSYYPCPQQRIDLTRTPSSKLLCCHIFESQFIATREEILVQVQLSNNHFRCPKCQLHNTVMQPLQSLLLGEDYSTLQEYLSGKLENIHLYNIYRVGIFNYANNAMRFEVEIYDIHNTKNWVHMRKKFL